MKLFFDDDLVEAVVFLCASGKRRGVPPLHVRRFHAERERAYSILDPDARNAAFARVHFGWFREWRVESALAAVVAQFPLLDPYLAGLAFRKARVKSEEGSELYGRPDGQRRGIVALRPERFEHEESLLQFLHHELMHLSDMLDPSFGYVPDLAQAGQTVSQQRLIRERYRLLWDVTIDGRLWRSGRATIASEAQRCAEFERGFGFLPEGDRAILFAQLWTGRLARHAELLAIASDPRHLNFVHQPLPGAPCPLCGFATFQWADPRALHADVVANVQREFPAWRPATGLCSRCAEIYSATADLELPSTVCL